MSLHPQPIGEVPAETARVPLHWLGEDRPAASLHGGGDERLKSGALAEWTATLQDTCDALRSPGPGRLTSPAVSVDRPRAGRNIPLHANEVTGT